MINQIQLGMLPENNRLQIRVTKLRKQVRNLFPRKLASILVTIQLNLKIICWTSLL